MPPLPPRHDMHVAIMPAYAAGAIRDVLYIRIRGVCAQQSAASRSDAAVYAISASALMLMMLPLRHARHYASFLIYALDAADLPSADFRYDVSL